MRTSSDNNSFDGGLQTRGAFFQRTGYKAVQDQIRAAARTYLETRTGKFAAEKAQERTCLVCGCVDSYLHFDDPYSPIAPHPSFLEQLTPEYLHDNLLSHYLCCYARPA